MLGRRCNVAMALTIAGIGAMDWHAGNDSTQRIQGYCALCKSRCGCISVVEQGRLVAVEADPSHPTGAHLCAKGRAAPELVHAPDRLTRPLRRSTPKGAADPGWQPISWDEALDSIADEMRRIADELGPESLAFAVTTPSGTAISDHIDWIERFIRAYGACNTLYATELCNWHKDHAHSYTFGSGVGLPDFERAGTILLWGHNPNATWLAHATRIAQAKARGAKLIVVDPRRAGLANKADVWIAPRPGTDGALALALAAVLIAEDSDDKDFLRRQTNAPYLVRDDNGRFLRGRDVGDRALPDSYLMVDARDGALLHGQAAGGTAQAALSGQYEVKTRAGHVRCRPAFAHYAELCLSWPPERAAEICGIEAQEIVDAARLIGTNGPLSYYHWTGVGQHSNATQTDRAIALLATLTGSRGRPGGNRLPSAVPSNDISGRELLSDGQRAKTLGLAARPLGPAAGGWVTAADFCDAVESGKPYPVGGLVAFGSNLLRSQPNSARMAAALERLPCHIHADLFMTPTAKFADIVLPVTSPWEHEALRLGFGGPQDGTELVQLRQAVVPPPGEARSDSAIVFDLALRLGLGDRFFGGSLEDAWRYQLAPSELTIEQLRDSPGGLRVTAVPADTAGTFATDSGRIEVYSELFHANGYEPVPRFREPAVGPDSRPDLAKDYPLILTCAKLPQFCHSQHRAVPSLRRHVPDPQVDLHPDTAASLGIGAGDWVCVDTPNHQVVMRAKLNGGLRRDTVCVQYGWHEVDVGPEPGSAARNANANSLFGRDAVDPVSGAPPLRAYLCRVTRASFDA